MKKILENQGYQLISGLLLTGLVWMVARRWNLDATWGGVSATTWLILALFLPILHQLYVAICWRSELYFGWLSRVLGQKAFQIYGFGFMILFLARPVTVLALGIIDQGSFPIPRWLNLPLIAVCLAVVVYMAYSFIKYFGPRRALGEDHFEPDTYRGLSMVKEGIFNWSANAMYTYAFLALWVIGLIFESRTALLIALYNHLFIWAHYYFTEKPDMQVIYGPK
jgi:hypothetical protein